MSPERTPVLRVVPYGAPARSALLEAITQLRDGDPLAPVTVVVPSALSGVTLRRSLANELGGLVGVAFMSLPGLAERLAAARVAVDGRRSIDPLTLRCLVSAVLAEDPGHFASTCDHPATVGGLAETIGELRHLRDSELDALGRASARAADVVRVHRAVRRVAAGWIDDHDTILAATAAVEAADSVVAEVGPVVVHLPRTLTRPELTLLGGLARESTLSVIVGMTGRPGADAPAHELVAQLSEATGARVDATDLDESIHHGATTIVVAPDPAEEARHALRIVLDAVAAGASPERIAVVSRTREPYTLLVHEELAAAGLNHSAPSPTRLAQSMAGRTLLGLLEWQPGGARRADLVRILRAAPVLDGRGERTRPDRWDRAARKAGVVGGLEQWRTRLANARSARVARLVQRDEPVEDDQRLSALDELTSFVVHVAALTEPGERRGWGQLARWAKAVLLAALGSEARAQSWPEPERAARLKVIELLDRLAGLDSLGPEPDAPAFLRTLEHELRQRSGRVGSFGHGVTVGRIVDAVGADLDLVVVLGGVEGAFPPRRSGDSLLPERERRKVDALRLRGSSREEEERDVWAVLAAARTSVIMSSAGDPRSQRAQHPAPWLVEMASARADREVTAGDLASGPPIAGVRVLASFEAWLGAGGAPATPMERDVAELIAAHRAGIDVASLPLAAAAGLGRGFAAARARREGRFDEWAGNVGHQSVLTGEAADHRSPTGLEMWSGCPFHYFLDKVLDVRALDDPGDGDTIAARDRGSLLHEIMEQFVSGHLDKDPAAAWTADARAELGRIADEVESRFREAGLTGRDVLWRSEWAALRRHLQRIVEHGIDAPELAGTVPIAVEHAFGFGGDEAPPVEVDLGGGRVVRFGGRIDRVDASPDGTKAVVIDYKAASPRGFTGMKSDVLDRGRRLQLPIYALAAKQLVPRAEQLAAYYWLVDPRYAMELKGDRIDDEVEAKFHEVLETVVGGIEAGLFPAHPGDDTWRPNTGPTFESCMFCDYDRVCARGRGEQWVKLRSHESLERYVELAEGPASAT